MLLHKPALILAATILIAAGLVPAARAAPSADLWDVWQASDEQSSETVDHGAWQTLLDEYLVMREDGTTAFRYRAVTDEHRGDLDGYIDRLAAIDPRRLARDEQLAYWINLYNALTVQVVLDHPGKQSIRRMGGGWFGSGPWDDELVTIAGQAVTLNDIEHRILRPIWRDHHIHYAVNCASVSCPRLAPEAYTAQNARRLMEEGERHYLNHPLGVELEGDTLHLSSIFDWYVTDFGGSEAPLLEYLAGERPDLADALAADARIRYRYDWSLNAAE